METSMNRRSFLQTAALAALLVASGATAAAAANTIAHTARRLIAASFDSGVAGARRDQCRVQPPSTIRTWPTTISDR